LFINDLIHEINSYKLGIDIDGYNLAALLYADDLVLMALSEENLQKLITVLYCWTLKWRISINKDKSQILHFRHHLKKQTEYVFLLGTDKIDLVNSYKYLGLTLDEHMKFVYNLDIMTSSAHRALGSVISKYRNYRAMGHKTYSKLFNSCVVPVLDYCSPVWSHTDSTKTETVQNRAMRAFLGVHRHAPLVGLYGDMGWLPSNYRRKIEVFRYWNRLIKLDDQRITKRIFLFDLNSNIKNSWSSYVKSLFSELGLLDVFASKQLCDLDVIKSLISQNFTQYWQNQLLSKPKLRFYRIYKTVPTVENYVLLNLSSVERSYMAQLRLGILPIEVETGRFRSIPLENRICKLCNLDTIENEKHILFKCSLYNDIRNIWLGKLRLSVPDFDNMNYENQLLSLFINPRLTAKYIVKLIELRKTKLFNV
jgi:hypothetical protein